MSDVLKAYQFVSENVPSWQETLHGLQTKIKKRDGHVSRAQAPAQRLKKPGSDESIRPRSNGEDFRLEMLSAMQDSELSHSIDTQQLAVPNPKRKTTSLLSNESIPTKFRTRSMIIVYYDSEIQKTFESVVRNIGTARNQLRRARTTLQMNALINGRDTPSAYSSQPTFGLASGSSSLPSFRSSRALMPERSTSEMPSSSQSVNLTAIDAALEKAQSLCERGAHQFLRDGDCEAEILGAGESFEKAKRLADRELDSLKQEADTMVVADSGAAGRQKLPPRLQGFLQNASLEIDGDSDDGEEVDDPIMKLARYPTRKTSAPLSVPA